MYLGLGGPTIPEKTNRQEETAWYHHWKPILRLESAILELPCDDSVGQNSVGRLSYHRPNAPAQVRKSRG